MQSSAIIQSLHEVTTQYHRLPAGWPYFVCTVYQELRDSGFEANSTTYNALISAYGKLGQLDRVLEVYKDMVWRGLERRCVQGRAAGQGNSMRTRMWAQGLVGLPQ